ncbi:hypothetical protein HAX54_049648 [Datura stramonium]|uniref:Rad21/Rec8-like protein C-terminal eukaryotic domain-containing protein n=1 Tax=Datura stramonium TaxID=4076 RepID=A0ABS8SVR3_DATST|nr:hypothetical protein [Datura stramonium]
MGIRKAFFSTNVNLPEGATHAPYHSITWPETFELDALDFNDDLDLNRFEDTHLKSHEEITFKDQILTHEDQYVAIFIDEDLGKSLSKSGEVSGLGAMPMETDYDPSNVDGIPAQFQNSSPKNQEELNGGTVQDHIPQDIPEIEIMRDAVHDHDSGNVPLWRDQWNDVMEPDKILEELIMQDKETASLVVEEMMERDVPPSATSAEVQEFTNPHISFGHQSPDLVLRSTPPPEEPKARRRKRKPLIDDDAIVLSNDQIGRLLNDTSALKHRRKNASLSSLDIWKLNKRHRKDRMLFEPLITGLCDDLCNIYKEDFISAKLKTASSQEEDHAEPSGKHSPPPGNDLVIEIERQRDNQESACTNLLSEIVPSPDKFIFSPPMSTPSPSRRDDFTPSTSYREGLGVENTRLSDIPEFDSSAGDLSFLDQDDRTPIGELRTSISSKQGETPEFDTSARTRAVAQFLQGKSPVTPISEDTGDLSLNTILEGKNKKICARMFFETLVLENCGLVYVNQNEPYGDITLKVTSRLKERFSS